jgi:hypothetical protein
MRLPALLAAATLVVLTVGVRDADACVCGVNPPCAAAWHADAVFVGTVVDRVSEVIAGETRWTVNHVAVTQRLRGSVDSFITLLPAARPTAEQIELWKSANSSGGFRSSCDYGFTVGRQYVIYARRTADGRWTTSECAGTKPIEDGAADLDYFASLSAAPATARIYGNIDRTVFDPNDRAKTRAVPAAGVSVELTDGSRRLLATTDAQGKLDVRVPPGDYMVAPIVTPAVRVYGAPKEVSAPARGCAPVYFSLISNGRIEGRVLSREGTGLAHASVDVIPADLGENEKPESYTTAPSGTTDEKGQFVVDAVLPGRYVIAINSRFGPRLRAPYATTYFPGGPRKDAEVVEIGDGERKTDFTIVVSPLREVTLSGVVTFDDARPVEEANVTVTPVDRPSSIMSSSRTNRTGEFELRVLAGLRYHVRASVRTADGVRQTLIIRPVEDEKEIVRLVIARP